MIQLILRASNCKPKMRVPQGPRALGSGSVLFPQTSSHLRSFPPAASVVPVHGFLRFNAKMHTGNGILRVASLEQRITKLLVSLRGLTEKVTLVVTGSRNPKIYVSWIARCGTVKAERPRVRN